jgi:hypothetical protein
MPAELMPTAVLFPLAYAEDFPVADTDWATGAMRIFMMYPEWERLLAADRASLSPDELYRIEAITHETSHLLQFVLTGFGYCISAKLFRAVAEALRDHPSLTAVYDHRSKYCADVDEVLTGLDIEGPDGVTTRSILESSSFHVQKSTHYPGMYGAKYRELLSEEDPGLEYKLAYDVAESYLFEEAFDHFTLIANLALMTKAPQNAFTPLVKAFTQNASRLDRRANYEMGLRFLREHQNETYIGTSWDYRREGALFQPILDRIRDLFSLAGKVNLIDLMATGVVRDEDVSDALSGPAFFLPEDTASVAPMRVPANWKVVASEDSLFDPGTIRLLMAASLVLQQGASSEEPA